MSQISNIDERLDELAEGKFEGRNYTNYSPSSNTNYSPSSSPKIQRIPAFLQKNENFIKYCTPKIVSFGPIHYSDENLKQGQRYKIQWTYKYIKDYSKQINRSTKEATQILFAKIEDNLDELKEKFSEDVIEMYKDKDEELAWILFMDGCSLLYYIRHVDGQRPDVLGLKLDQLMYSWRDILLLENQIPMKVLELLSEKKGVELVMLVYNFQTLGLAKQDRLYNMAHRENSIHILDFCRTIYVVQQEHVVQPDQEPAKQKDDDDDDDYGYNQKMTSQTYKNIRDLKTAGIEVKATKTDKWSLRAVNFTSGCFGGELNLPVCRFNDIMPYFFTNLIAYEMCPDFHNNFEFCSFFTFMDSLIDDAADVKELRLAGVFPDSLNSDEELAKFFNELGNDLPTNLLFNNPQFGTVVQSMEYKKLTHRIQNHYSNYWKTWMAEARHTYFNTPWSFTAFLAASAALALTAAQTWYAVHPKS